MLRGKRVTLRPTERADLPRLWGLLEDMDVAVSADAGPIVPVSLASYEARFDRHLAEPPDDLVEFAIEVEDDLSGVVSCISSIGSIGVAISGSLLAVTIGTGVRPGCRPRPR